MLPVIQNSDPNRIQDFYEKLVISVQALDTMNKLKEINGYARLTLDKLPGIRADLVTRNPKIIPSPEKGFKRENAYQKNDKNYN